MPWQSLCYQTPEILLKGEATQESKVPGSEYSMSFTFCSSLIDLYHHSSQFGSELATHGH
jgi:hypothetical protein